MKKGIFLAFTVLMLVFAGVLPAHAREHEGGHEGGHERGGFVFRGGVFIGPGWGWWGPWWGPPYYPYPYPYYPYPAQPYQPYMEDQSPVYVEPPAQEEEEYYWYFCTNPQGYYPYVKQCPGGWLKVVPSVPSSPGQKE